jgi:hypothetical protein
MMETYTDLFPVELSSGAVVYVETVPLGGEEDVAFEILQLQSVMETIEDVANQFAATLERIRPDKASVELGVDFGVESGKLTALIVKGSANASLTITLEWERAKPRPPAKDDGKPAA